MIPGLTPEQEARVRAVTHRSSGLERAGAMLMGVYHPASAAEVEVLVWLARRVLRKHGHAV